MIRAFLTLLLLSASVLYARADEAVPFAASGTLSADELTVGDETMLRIGVPDGETPVSEPRVEQLPEGWTAKRIVTSEKKDGIEVHLAPFDLKLESLGAVRVGYESISGKRVVLETAPLPVTIRKLTTEQDVQLRDIHGPQTVALTWWKYLLYFVGAVVLLGLAVSYGRRLRRAEGAMETPSVPPVPPHERALAALAALEAEDLPGRGEIERHCTQLSEIFRRYLEDRFGFLALEQTTEEIRSALNQVRDVAAPLRVRALALLGEWDVVKFANIPMDAARARESLAQTRAWVEETKPLPVVAPAEAPVTAPLGEAV